MNIRTAVLEAADHIETNPGEFSFLAGRRPDGPGCGTPGCALGWIGFFADTSKRYYTEISEELLGVPAQFIRVGNSWHNELSFEGRMSLLNDGWMFSAHNCAAALRAYADKYHPAAVYPNACINPGEPE